MLPLREPFWLSVNPSWVPRCLLLVSLWLSAVYLGSGEDSPTKLSLPLTTQAHYRNSPGRCSASENQTFELSVCLPSDPQASLNNILVDIQRPRLEANQWLKSFMLDPRFLLEVTPIIYINTL